MASVTGSPSAVCFLSTATSIAAPCSATDVITSTILVPVTIGPSDPNSSPSGSSAPTSSDPNASPSASSAPTSSDPNSSPNASAAPTSSSGPDSSQSITAGPSSLTGFITSTSQTATTSPTSHATTTSSSPRPTATTPAPASAAISSKHQISSGALAGGVVGAFVGGLILAALIYLCLRRGKRGLASLFDRSYAARTTTSINSDRTIVPALIAKAKTPAATTTPVIDTKAFLPFLPESATDDAIRRSLQGVMDQIESHVEWHYQDDTVDINTELLAELSRFETGKLSKPLQACFEMATVPTVLIKHCLMFHIFNHTVSPGEGISPILPNEIAGSIGALYNQSLKPDASPEQIQAFALQKSLTTYLLPALTLPRGRKPAPSPQAQMAKRFATEFTEVFKPWSSALSDTEQRAEHLSQIIQEAVRVATWLFGQPDLIKFYWSLPTEMARRDSQGECVPVSPSVVKVVVDGRRLENEVRLLSAVVKRM